MASKRGKRFIFVGGAARSGTTLVQNILDSHPAICGAPEFMHIPDIICLRDKLHYSIEREWINLICSNEDVDSCLASLLEKFLLPLADKYGCRFLSEKTPDNVLVFSELISMFPGARFIFVVRDPRAVIASMLQVGRRAKQMGGEKRQAFLYSVSAAAEYISKCLQSGAAALKIAPERVFVIIYERLVSDPETETKNMCKFLQLEWSSQMLHPGSHQHLGGKAITNNGWYDIKSYYRDPETSEIDKWKTQLTPIQQVIITTVFRNNKTLAQFGYDLSLEGCSLPNRILTTMLKTLTYLNHDGMKSRLARIRRCRLKVRQGLRFLHHMINSQ